jgi:2-phosphoglycerate kinase
MLYMIGGAPRSGKTTLARRMLAEHGVPYFSIDTLIASLASERPELGMRVSDPALKRVEIVWPTIRKVVNDVLHSGDDLLLEGDVLLPKHLIEFGHEPQARIKACFIGYADADPVTKLRAIREHAAGGIDWTEELDDDRLLNLIGELRAFSEYLRRECRHYKIPYFDGSTCFTSAIREAKTYLHSAA